LGLVLLSLPLFAYFLHRRQRSIQSQFAVLLNELARQWKLMPIREQLPSGAARPDQPEARAERKLDEATLAARS